MKIPTTYTAKAFLYARYRWDYASAALQALFAMVPLGPAATIIDLAAGTGILTRYLLGHAGHLLAIEPDAGMAPFARLDARPPHGQPTISTIRAVAEAIPLPAACADLVTVAQAVHWFDPQPARAEIRRILRPGGWLALFNNRPVNTKSSQALEQALAALPVVPKPADTHTPNQAVQPPEYYFSGSALERQVFPFTFRQDFTACLGGLLSASFNPNPGDPDYPAFERTVREVFDQFAGTDKLIEVRGETTLWLGQL